MTMNTFFLRTFMKDLHQVSEHGLTLHKILDQQLCLGFWALALALQLIRAPWEEFQLHG